MLAADTSFAAVLIASIVVVSSLVAFAAVALLCTPRGKAAISRCRRNVPSNTTQPVPHVDLPKLGGGYVAVQEPFEAREEDYI